MPRSSDSWRVTPARAAWAVLEAIGSRRTEARACLQRAAAIDPDDPVAAALVASPRGRRATGRAVLKVLDR